MHYHIWLSLMVGGYSGYAYRSYTCESSFPTSIHKTPAPALEELNKDVRTGLFSVPHKQQGIGLITHSTGKDAEIRKDAARLFMVANAWSS